MPKGLDNIILNPDYSDKTCELTYRERDLIDLRSIEVNPELIALFERGEISYDEALFYDLNQIPYTAKELPQTGLLQTLDPRLLESEIDLSSTETQDVRQINNSEIAQQES